MMHVFGMRRILYLHNDVHAYVHMLPHKTCRKRIKYIFSTTSPSPRLLFYFLHYLSLQSSIAIKSQLYNINILYWSSTKQILLKKKKKKKKAFINSNIMVHAYWNMEIFIVAIASTKKEST